MNNEPFRGVLAKPPRRAVQKAQAKRRHVLARRQVRELVYRRERMICQRCGKRTKLPRACYPGDPDMAHVHESPPRSLGGDPLDPDCCQLLCGSCHLPNGVHTR